MLHRIAVLALAGALALPARAENPDDARQKALNQLENTKISLEFKDATLDEVVDFLHEVTKINFVMSKGVREKAQGDELRVTIRVNELPLKSALKLLLEMNDLAMIWSDGVLLIQTKEERGGDVKMEMIDVKDLMMKIQDFPGPELQLETTDDGIPTIGITEPEKPFESREGLESIIRNATGGDATWSRDGVSLTIENGLLIVAHNEETIKEVRRLIESLRQFK
ncbi:MAG: hypothetical protein HYY18_00295 [Planctomycetes bacterium]|nr:hypothetical protein [Planctomycetota bacterium]